METLRPSPLLLAWFCLGFLLFDVAPRTAQACSRICYETIAPRAGTTIPSGTSIFFTTSPPGMPPRLVDGAGQEVPSVFDTNLVTPQESLPPGDYTLHFETCDVPKMHPFRVGPFVALPTALGNLTVSPLKVEPTGVPHVGACTEVVESAFVTLDLEPTPELAAYLEVAVFTLEVDGQSWSSRRLHPEPGREDDSRSPFKVYARCAPHENAFFEAVGLPEGDHRGRLTAQIPGLVWEAPAIEFDFHLSCTPPTEASGCSYVPASRAAALWGLVSLCIIALGIRRRARP